MNAWMREPVFVAAYIGLALFLGGCSYGFWLLMGAPTGVTGQIYILTWLATFYVAHHSLRGVGQQALSRQRLEQVLEGTGLLAWPGKRTGSGGGQLRGLSVSLAVLPVEDGLRLQVSIPGLTRALRLSTTEHVSGEPLHIGDPAFDGTIYLSGDRVEALALLDAETRETISKLGIASLRVEDGELRAELLMYPADAETVRASLRYLGDIAYRLRRRDAEREEYERSLLEASRDAPRAEMRFQLLNALLRGAEIPAIRDEALALAGDDRRLALAVMVARGELGDVEKLTALVADGGLQASIRREALGHLPADAADAAALSAALSDHDRLLRAAALRRVSMRPRTDAGLEARLLEMLGRSQGWELEAVVRALASAGGKTAVEPLKAMSGRSTGALARAAVNAIQGRLVNAEVGAFAVTEQQETEGSVSLAADAGAIALSKARAKT